MPSGSRRLSSKAISLIRNMPCTLHRAPIVRVVEIESGAISAAIDIESCGVCAPVPQSKIKRAVGSGQLDARGIAAEVVCARPGGGDRPPRSPETYSHEAAAPLREAPFTEDDPTTAHFIAPT